MDSPLYITNFYYGFSDVPYVFHELIVLTTNLLSLGPQFKTCMIIDPYTGTGSIIIVDKRHLLSI